jgi:hypothetical protein
MREHPIPQDITGYKFHIIGNMTLKQFAELAAGALLGLAIYSTNLVVPIKWPLIFMAIGMGAAAAFLPFEERPLDHWIMTFVKIMYRPTKYFWQRSQKIPDAFLYTPNSKQTEVTDTLDLTPARHERIREYLASMPSTDQVLDPLAQQEELWMKEIMEAFHTVKPSKVSATPQAHRPDLTTRVRSLKLGSVVNLADADTNVTVFDQKQRQTVLTKHQKTIEEVAINISVPEADAPIIEHQQAEQAAEAQAAVGQTSAYINSGDVQASESLLVNHQSATFNASLPFPSAPTEPNKLVGMILTPNNELIPEAIVEVRDDNNRVVRAVKSNALGQFFITTPLKSGSYSVVVEHDRYQFSPIAVSLQDEVVDPIEIRSLG